MIKAAIVADDHNSDNNLKLRTKSIKSMLTNVQLLGVCAFVMGSSCVRVRIHTRFVNQKERRPITLKEEEKMLLKPREITEQAQGRRGAEEEENRLDRNLQKRKKNQLRPYKSGSPRPRAAWPAAAASEQARTRSLEGD